MSSKLSRRTFHGQFVAIAHGKLVAAGPTLEEVSAQAESTAPRVTHHLIVKIGEDYPPVVTIGASPVHG
jgi:hypothetical protein